MYRRTFLKLGLAAIPLPAQAMCDQLAEAKHPTVQSIPEFPLPSSSLVTNEQKVNMLDGNYLDDLLGIQLGFNLVRDLIHCDEDIQNSQFIHRIKQSKLALAQEFGFPIVPVNIRDDFSLKHTAYRITLRGVELGQGEVYPGKYLVISTGSLSDQLPTAQTTNFAFRMPSIWLEPGQLSQVRAKGYAVADAWTVVSMHFTQLVRPYVAAHKAQFQFHSATSS